MAKYARIRDTHRHIRRHRRKTTETGWGRSAAHGLRSWFWLGSAVMLVAVAVVLFWPERNRHEAAAAPPDAAPEAPDDLRPGLEAAEGVARAFLAEADPRMRLQWVRHREEVKNRLAEYPEEARTSVGEIESVLGHQVDGGRSVSAFVVVFPSGNLRLLEVVGTADGPRVDWDAYARHGTASWDDLWSGEAGRAVVRVFCEPATERPEPFQDQSQWTGFRLSGQDLPHAALGFAELGSIRESMMKKVVLGTPEYRQRFTLEVVRHEGQDEPLFEITRCLAVGWILGESDVEELWTEP